MAQKTTPGCLTAICASVRTRTKSSPLNGQWRLTRSTLSKPYVKWFERWPISRKSIRSRHRRTESVWVSNVNAPSSVTQLSFVAMDVRYHYLHAENKYEMDCHMSNTSLAC